MTDPNDMSRIYVMLSGVLSAIVVLTIYHCFTTSCKRRNPSPEQPEQHEQGIPSPPGLDDTIAQMIPSYRYDKEVGLIGDDAVCAICLSEFEEGQEVRTLPECVHSFHVPCIDMWLYSHTSCPLCRTDTTPPHSQTLLPLAYSGGVSPLEDLTTSAVRTS